MPSGKLSTWQKAGDGNSTSISTSSHSHKVFHNSPTPGRRISCRFDWVADVFSGRQGRDALLLTERAFPISAATGLKRSHRIIAVHVGIGALRRSSVAACILPAVEPGASRPAEKTPAHANRAVKFPNRPHLPSFFRGGGTPALYGRRDVCHYNASAAFP